ncbi:MAG: hypothetical protein ACI9JM_002103 [Halioglobus sp.]|jgi:hypothetical protein
MIAELTKYAGDALAFEISGKVSIDEEKMWIARIEQALQANDKLKVMVVLGEGASWGLKAGVEDVKWVLKHMDRIERIAFVSSSKVWKWLISVDSVFAQMVGIKERHFDTAEVDDAWSWLTQ